ncbi:LTA synthase family protein [Akkermansia muciniphila]|uniref:LTA synthase family protein n=1 Tax=Akkermansia muciniphila TaxID=239935 RepID=UPI001C062797|nr:sulfatase-like hydrolase/transferase [Akkermansia muciniphila]QWP58953.1 sulfatase-like hydrolase/transferase [Akkermansia muciniphila]
MFTTSNHRPYTYPEGRIDIPSHTGRMGAVKYADYAVGAFVEEARTKPWFDNTLFVFVGDHGAGSAGKQALNPETHRIFSIFYAPALLKPERRDTPVSQIDVLPTLLGLLNWPYDAAFYGKDALKPSYQSRYFVSNYQYIGYLKGKDMVVLKPQRGVEFFRDGEAVEPDGRMKELEREAVYYYQHASGWRTSLKE